MAINPYGPDPGSEDCDCCKRLERSVNRVITGFCVATFFFAATVIILDTAIRFGFLD
jgi:hypothetical protein